MIPQGGNRFSDKVMRHHFNKLAREPQISIRNLRKLDCYADKFTQSAQAGVLI
jgi:hypothetical protein